jgi:hypothetical protein
MVEPGEHTTLPMGPMCCCPRLSWTDQGTRGCIAESVLLINNFSRIRRCPRGPRRPIGTEKQREGSHPSARAPVSRQLHRRTEAE